MCVDGGGDRCSFCHGVTCHGNCKIGTLPNGDTYDEAGYNDWVERGCPDSRRLQGRRLPSDAAHASRSFAVTVDRRRLGNFEECFPWQENTDNSEPEGQIFIAYYLTNPSKFEAAGIAMGWSATVELPIIIVFVILFALVGAITCSDARRGSMAVLDVPGMGKGGGGDGGGGNTASDVCSKCNTKLNGSTFCSQCGTKASGPQTFEARIAALEEAVKNKTEWGSAT